MRNPAEPGSLLSLAGVGKDFGATRALKDVSLCVRPGETLGLAGENGAGKSTLLNVLGGVHERSRGEILWEGRPYCPKSPRDAADAGLAFIHQELNLFPNLSVAENLFLPDLPRRPFWAGRSVKRRELHGQAREVLREVGLDRDPGCPLHRLSAGERQLVEIAKALKGNAKLILFDEPTTSLSQREKDRLFEVIARLKGRGIAMVYISHALDDLQLLCDRIAVLRDGSLVGEGERGSLPSSKLISMMIGRPLEQAFPERSSTPGERILLEARAFQSAAMRQPVDLRLRESEILGIAGLMGSGRSELLRGLFGIDGSVAGELECLGERLEQRPLRSRIESGMAMVTESRGEDGLCLSGSVRENVLLSAESRWSRTRFRWVSREASGAAVAAVAEEVQLDRKTRLEQAVGELSGGNQQKVVFGKWMLREPKVLLLDEPTRGVDVGAKFEIYSLLDRLAGRGAGVLVVSSEIEELMGICDRIVVMGAGGRLTGSFDRKDFDREQLLGAAIEK